MEDADSDGATAEVDCDESDASIYPGADELCDGIDQDCDGQIDEDAVDSSGWYSDQDGDGFGAGDAALACDKPDGSVSDQTDCDDGDALIYPGADELCDGVDQNCDGRIDEDAIDPSSWYSDQDGDGFGVGDVILACTAPDKTAAQSDDCDDGNDAVYPSAPELDCSDPVDYNCDGSTGFADGDGDGFSACVDCNDDDELINTDAVEICDGVDNNCDEQVDESGATGETTWFTDADDDGHGALGAASVLACDKPAFFAALSDDCDDSAELIFPGAAEVCDGVDNNCDEVVDLDAIDRSDWFLDSDGDGFGDPNEPTTVCNQPDRYVSDQTDCDDSTDRVKPSGVEVKDGLDNDCDTLIDEDFYTFLYGRDIQPIFNAGCTRCHGSSGGLSLVNGYDNIVNIHSNRLTSMLLIASTDPGNSYLWHKLSGTQASVGGAGGAMPQGGTLSGADMLKIETWITEGAPR